MSDGRDKINDGPLIHHVRQLDLKSGSVVVIEVAVEVDPGYCQNVQDQILTLATNRRLTDVGVLFLRGKVKLRTVLQAFKDRKHGGCS